MGAHDFKHYKVPLFATKTGNINTSRSAAPKLALVPASRYYCDVNWSYHNGHSQVSLGVKDVQMGHMTSNITRCLFLLQNQGISILRGLLPRN